MQRVESLVLQTARARELVTAQHVSTARAAHAQAVARGQDSNVLAHLARQLDPAARASVQKLYHMAMRAESTSDSGSGTTSYTRQTGTHGSTTSYTGLAEAEPGVVLLAYDKTGAVGDIQRVYSMRIEVRAKFDDAAAPAKPRNSKSANL